MIILNNKNPTWSKFSKMVPTNNHLSINRLIPIYNPLNFQKISSTHTTPPLSKVKLINFTNLMA